MMSIFKDSYQTTVGSVFNTKPIETAIKESIIKDSLDYVNLNVTHEYDTLPIFLTGRLPSESNIPLFTHPISIFNLHNKNYLCTDMRLFFKKDHPYTNLNDENGIRNITEFKFNKSRAILNLLWLEGKYSEVRNNLAFAGIVFAAWLSEAISKTYALDFKDQTTLAIITSFYYQTLFYDTSDFSSEELKEKMAVHTIKATKAPATLVMDIFDKISDKKIANVEDYCSLVSSTLENVRLNNFNLAMLLTIVKNSWYGTNAKEVISVAVEHPPTWCAVVYTALSERTYKTSMIFKIAERFGKRGAADEFLRSYSDMMRSYISVATEEAPIEIKEFI